ncbi:MAG TPA: hypothetical protein VJ916_08735 [Anaerovoracaceae bacterium]|nr:hypothetical protein [Anaerovoracaceae bacterium]
MNKEKLFETLGIEGESDFEYFDNMADLLEMDEEYSEEVVYALLEDVDLPTFKALFETYFDDLINNLPEKDTELNSLIEMMKLAFMGLCNGGANAETYERISEEIIKFRNWYVFDENVDHEGKFLSVRDAITNCRINKLSGNEEDFDFTEALEYDIDEYAISLEDMDEYEEI